MRALKILVVVMGVLLIAGTTALVMAVVARVNHPPARERASIQRASAVDLPPGAHVVGTQASGNRLVVTIGLAEGGEELLIFDLADGTRIAAITLQTREAPPRGDLPETPLPQR